MTSALTLWAPAAARAAGAAAPDASPTKLPVGLLGTSPAMRDLAEQVAALAASGVPVLITGEVGTGKGGVAAYVHARGGAPTRPFVALRCAASVSPAVSGRAGGVPNGGTDQGGAPDAQGGEPAPTDPTAPATPPAEPPAAEAGVIEAAWDGGGTLFLDEVAALDSRLQDLLAGRVRAARRPQHAAGDRGDRGIPGNSGEGGGPPPVRLVASTARDLVTEVTEGRFREDLYYHLSARPVHLPPLRARTADDVATLVAALAAELAAEIPDAPPVVHGDALGWLVQYSWPGNVREMRSVLERALLAARGAAAVASAHLPPDLRPGVSEAERHLPRTLEQVQRTHIERTLRVHQQNRTRAARELGISRATLIKKIKEYGLKP